MLLTVALVGKVVRNSKLVFAGNCLAAMVTRPLGWLTVTLVLASELAQACNGEILPSANFKRM